MRWTGADSFTGGRNRSKRVATHVLRWGCCRATRRRWGANCPLCPPGSAARARKSWFERYGLCGTAASALAYIVIPGVW